MPGLGQEKAKEEDLAAPGKTKRSKMLSSDAFMTKPHNDGNCGRTKCQLRRHSTIGATKVVLDQNPNKIFVSTY